MKTILAVGADIKNRFLIAKGEELSYGPDIGDLGFAENYVFFTGKIREAAKKHAPDIIACDLHPGYFSTKFAKDHNPEPVQHHHAHIASVIAEHGLKKPVIGVSFDGTGFGTDGNMWGGEFLLVSGKKFKRLAHFAYCKMPGGDKVVSEPWRMAISILGERALPFLKGVGKKEKKIVLDMCAKNINSPLTSSAGRLFDGAAALIGVCTHASFEAEGPIKLEKMCKSGVEESYGFRLSGSTIDVAPLFLGIVKDLKIRKDKRVIATKFHNSMAHIIVKTIKKLSKDTGIKDIALSGGVFQNKFLREKTIKSLSVSGFRVFINEKTPVNDLNISLGQFYVSSCTGKS